MSTFAAVSFRHRRSMLIGFIIALSVLSWAYLLYLASNMAAMKSGSMAMDMMMPASHAWTLPDFEAMFVMWSVMMVAMMLPSASPMILLFEKISEGRATQSAPRPSSVEFMAGYLLIWTGFSLLATLLNWALHSAGVLDSMMGKATPVVAGATLLVAGIYQWTPLKNACLAQCRSPVQFLLAHWSDRRFGAVQMGAQHGLFCLGCCWFLMLLLFALGVMNLLWIAVLTVIVLAEKILPAGDKIARFTGLLLFLWGSWIIRGQFT